MHVLSILYLVASVASIFLYIMSVQCKKKETILTVQIAASLCYLTVYSIKGLWSGVASEVIEELKDVAFIRIEKKYKKIPLYVLFLFLAILSVVGFYFYDGPYSLIPLGINLILFISTYFKNPQVIRYVMVLCAILWGIYNYLGGAYIILIGNALEFISAFISIYRFQKK